MYPALHPSFCQSWPVLREDRQAAPWGLPVPFGRGGFWWRVGKETDFSQPPAWTQNFCHKHIHTCLHPYLLCKPLVWYSLADTMTLSCFPLGHLEGEDHR